MGFSSSRKSSPPPIKPAPPPIPTDNTAEVEARRKAERERIRKMRGRKATILTGGRGMSGDAETGRKSLLGE